MIFLLDITEVLCLLKTYNKIIMKLFVKTTFILFFIGAITILIKTLMTVEEYKDRLEQKELEYKELNTLFLWYEHEYLKSVYDIPKDSIELRLPPEYTTDY
jgi:hypothetical protein